MDFGESPANTHPLCAQLLNSIYFSTEGKRKQSSRILTSPWFEIKTINPSLQFCDLFLSGHKRKLKKGGFFFTISGDKNLVL